MLLSIKEALVNKPLKTLERFLQVDATYLAGGSFWLILGKGVNMFVALLLSVIYARYLLKETYGDYRYVLSIFGMLGIFALPGLATAINRSVARGHERTFVKGARIILLSSFSITLIGIGIGLVFLSGGRPELAYSFFAVSAIIPFTESFGIWRGYYDGERKFKEKTFFNLISHI